MPIYEYACRACGHEFEREQRISDAPVRTCPKCKRRRVERLISQTSFVLKGGGWYSDLYASSKGKSKEGDSGKDAAASKAESSEKKAPSEKKEPSEKKSGSGGSKPDSGGSKSKTKAA
jgi:putative FmdB family regulatory protein